MIRFLQITNTPNSQPRILEMGKDFYNLGFESSSETDPSLFNINGDILCNLSDCFQQRQLIEIDGFGEFNILVSKTHLDKPYLYNFKSKLLYEPFDKPVRIHETMFYDDCINNGSIFTSENQLKYPELYKQALKIINQ
jgi:hypothetical protein